MEEKKKIKHNHESKGITLIALVITIIILLILAGIVLATLSGENEILKRGGEAKEKTMLGNEKEIIALAMNEWRIEQVSNPSEIFATFMQDKMQSNANVQRVDKVTDNEVVVIYKSGNIYCFNTEDEIEQIHQDENPGELEDIGDDKLQIGSIEDLLVVAYNVNTAAETYEGKTIELSRNLDFQNNYSYSDASAKYILESAKGYVKDDSGTPIKELLLDETGKGFIPIGLNGGFKGNFDGKGKKLKNIYINSDIFGRTIWSR